ncbi:MAG: TlpA disulfide reductase family protein [Candidatus Omnitrophota bacterium]|nr:TlpA family protein disulfide reductase [Candidatus Omnitrophota bacterium]MBU1894963.1 TlpA family protein disulfide reductase [Candidatus Omnitrophota bacterium]
MKKNGIRRFVSLVMAVFVLTICLPACARPVSPGQSAPDFTLETLEGAKIALTDELKTKKVVLVFFAMWCPHCVSSVPDVNAFYSKNKDKVSVIAIDIQEPRGKVESFIRKRNVEYPVVIDSTASVSNNYGISGIPTVIAIDENKKVLYRGTSIVDLENKIEF